MNAKLQYGQVVRLREAVTNQAPWSFAKGSLGTVVGRDAQLVKVRMCEHQTTISVWPGVLEGASLPLQDVA